MTIPSIYSQRRDAGVCVRCGKPSKVKDNGELAALCQEHLTMHRRYDKDNKVRADDPGALAHRPEAPRAPYKGDLPPMPPVPDKCPRCKGFILTQYEETRCINCAWYLLPEPIPLDEIDLMKGGPQLPVVME